jgi:class 3 adenylate cyclase/tetratricopeptide (TPR) repeat protein
MARTVQQIESSIAALQSQRALLGDEVVDTATAALRGELATLQAEQPALADQHLSLVSVLFLDIVGSTALSRSLDPEDIQAVLDGALAAFTTVVDQHGGRVLQYAGDSVLAVFGADEVHEDDAERAVLAGLALLRQGQLQALLLKSRHPELDLGVRVGISSGRVLLGGGVDGASTIRGNTVNIAARMEQAAPPGALRISQETWRLVRGLFVVAEQPPLLIKGRDEPLQTYLVHSAIESPASASRRGVQGVRVPLLGRDDELALLQQAFADVASGRTGQLSVTVVADAGLGKSRLFDELDLWWQHHHAGLSLLIAQAAEGRRGQSYGLMRELFMRHLGLDARDVTGDLRTAWLQAVQPVLGDRSSAAVLGHLLGLNFSDETEVHALRNDARALRDRAFFHAFQWLTQIALAAPPLVLALDDIHWADDGSLDFLEELQRAHAQLPLLLLSLARPLLLERRPQWCSSGDRARRINLAPLGALASQTLSKALLQHLPEVPAHLAQLVAQGAEGNPFFMEELVNMLIDQGAIEVQGDRWTLAPNRLMALQLPTTLEGVLQARLSALPQDRRRALQLASVVGTVFWDQALQELDVAAVSALGELANRELIQPRQDSRLAGSSEYEFRHHTVHRVAYDNLLKRVRAVAHGLLARWLDKQPAAPALQDQIAEHFERAGDTALACAAWTRAAQAAQLRFANADALGHAARAWELTSDNDITARLAITLVRVRVLEHLADRPPFESAVLQLQQLAEGLGDAGWRSEAASWGARFEYHGGDAQAALRWAEQAVALAPAGDLERSARAHSQVFFALARLGRQERAREAFLVSLRAAQQAGHAILEATIVNEEGNQAHRRGDVASAILHWQQALAVHRQEGHLANAGGTLCNLAFAALSIGDFEAAKLQFEQARELSERVGARHTVGVIDINLGLAWLNLGQAEHAQRCATQALAQSRSSGDRWAEAAALRVLGRAELLLGLGQAAQARFVASRELFDELKLGHLALEAVAALVDEALARGDVPAAAQHAQDIHLRQQAGAGIEGTDEPMRILLAQWRAWVAASDPRAPAALLQAQQELLRRADRLTDPEQRQRFMQGVTAHRDILNGAD